MYLIKAICTVRNFGLENLGCILRRSMASSSDSNQKFKNRLSQEKSPYLLQHASNPVDWYPWGEEAFEKARLENKLIFLSVGYSTCHWCHVMERESFENEDIGKYMSENYVCIKVDREERPDVDRVYMNFVQASTGAGGWPMSVWLTPELKPVVGGTYFPPNDRYFGRPGFKNILQHVLSKWKQDADGVRKQGQSILEALKKHAAAEAAGAGPPSVDICVPLFVSQLTRSYDEDMGGFGKAPKFPQPVNFNMLLRAWANDKESESGKNILRMVKYTLEKMAKGGMYDHVGKGFHRYSTDNDWHVPHFEKMLYDQAQLAVTYSEMYQISKEEKWESVLRDILEYVNRDLSHSEGGFYSAEDADSLRTPDATEKKEGAFCVWTKQEITSLLNQPITGKDGVTVADVFCYHYDVKVDGNVNPMQDPHDELKHQNVLIVRGDVTKTAEHFSLASDDVIGFLTSARDILFQERKKRPPPHLDNKMLTAWNGMMISGFAKAGQALHDTAYVERGLRAAEFVKQYMYNEDTATLLRCSYVNDDNQVVQISHPIDGFVDDYCNMIAGLLDLYEASQEQWLIRWAARLQEKQNELFWDKEMGGYFSNTDQDPSIVMRLKEDQDGAEPSPNSVSVNNLMRLGTYLTCRDYFEKAEKTLASFNERLEKIPVALPQMLCGLMLYHKTPKQIIIVGDLEKEDTRALLECVHSHFLPNKILLHIQSGCDVMTKTNEQQPTCETRDVNTQMLDLRIDDLQNEDMLKKLTMLQGKATAYVCENFVCSLPVNNDDDLGKVLAK